MVYSRGAALPFRRPISFTILVQNIEREAFYFFLLISYVKSLLVVKQIKIAAFD